MFTARTAIIVSALFLGACQVAEEDNSFSRDSSPEGARVAGIGAYGDWSGLPRTDMDDGGFAEFVLEIRPDQVTLRATCMFADGSVEIVEATSDADVQQKSITVFTAVESSENGCTATLDAGVLGYGVTANQMRLLRGGEFFQLNRI